MKIDEIYGNDGHIYIVLKKLMKYRKYQLRREISETNLVLNMTEE